MLTLQIECSEFPPINNTDSKNQLIKTGERAEEIFSGLNTGN
jgi:hypothetical protein